MKQQSREAFYQCKLKCVCKEEICRASGLKECSSCHDILKSVCTKAGCKQPGRQRPIMIVAAASSSHTRVKLVNRLDVVEEEDSMTEEDVMFDDSDNDLTEDSEEDYEKMEIDKDEMHTMAIYTVDMAIS